MNNLFESFNADGIKEFVSVNRRLVKFLVRLFTLILLWKVMFHFIWHNPSWLQAYNEFALLIISYVLEGTGFLLELIGYEVFINHAERLVGIAGTTGIEVGEPCIGINTIAFFCALILSDKGRIRVKLWFIPLGALIICLLNLIRISVLAMIIQINPVIWELNHKFVFSLFIFGMLLFFWMIWLKKYSLIRGEGA